MNQITVKLDQPIALDNGQSLEEVTLRAYRAGDAARARAFIANSKAYGPNCVNDSMIMSLVMLRFCLVGTGQAIGVKADWPDQLGGKDFSTVIDSHEAVSQGYENVEAYRAHVEKLTREAQAKAEQDPLFQG